MDATNLADLYNSPLMDWEPIANRLAAGLSLVPGSGGPDRHSCWLATINADGTPHLTGIGAVWLDDTFWFETGETSRKGRNLARDPRCAISIAAAEFDLTVDGAAHLVDDADTVARLAAK